MTLPPPPPPPSSTGPTVFFPPPSLYPPPQRGGFARAIFTGLAVSILGLSISLNLYFLVYSGLLSGEPLRKSVIRSGNIQQTIAVVPLQGVIDDQKAAELNDLLGEVENDPTVRAIVLEVDSPGGGVTASDQIYDRLIRLRSEKKIPVVVSMGALATSGGYYIACAADQIVAQRTTWTGNIGVLLPRYNFSKLANQYGVEDTTIKSTGADFKDAGSPFKPDTPEQTAYFQKLADDAFGVFKGVVGKGRSLDADTVARIANGKVYNGTDALNLKLVDAIGYLDDAIDLAAQKANLGTAKPQAVRFEKKVGLFEALGRSSAQSSKLTLPVGGPGVSIDRSVIDQVLTPRPLYLWRGQ